MKLATWNVNSLSVRLPQVIEWLNHTGVDALALQETKLTDERFPHDAFEQIGYQSACFGQKTYNGVAIISKKPLNDVICNNPDFTDAQARIIAATIDDIRFISAYIPNGQAPGTEKFEYKMNWLFALQGHLEKTLAQYPRLILSGDFNIAPTDEDVYDPVLWKDQILCTEEERFHFKKLLSLGLHDAFRLFEQEPKSWSWWDYRNFAFRKNLGLRIDHILVSDALKASVQTCSIDKQPRKNERPSDHTPVIVQL